MINAILFDLGGTLDADGIHWLDRFYLLYEQAGLDYLPKEKIKEAFYWADEEAFKDPVMPHLRFRPMLEKHVSWQFSHLGLNNPTAQQKVLDGFAKPAERIMRRNRKILSDLFYRGYSLGIISNFYGNVSTLCQEFGYSPFLKLILDSRVEGIRKPDSKIFERALEKLKLPAPRVAYVGDSFERDVVPAKTLGFKTVWLMGPLSRPCPDPKRVDYTLRSLEELLEILEKKVTA